MVWTEDQAPPAGKVERKLPSPITLERVWVASHEIRHPARRFQIAQACAQLARASCAELLLGGGLFFTPFSDFLVLKVDFQGLPILSIFTEQVKF